MRYNLAAIVVLSLIMSCEVFAASRSTLCEKPTHMDVAAQSPASLDEMYQQLESRRALQIDRLHFYAARGTFPRNTDFPGQFVPYFVDRFGIACAVGYLVQQDGLCDLVAAIATQDNHIRIGDVNSGPLIDWIVCSGLTKQECALIQPGYGRIEDYRRFRQWQEEIDRLRDHFSQVEETLITQSQRSLEEALKKRIDTEIEHNPAGSALGIARIMEALNSKEASVRIGAAYALSRSKYESEPREMRITALKHNLTDASPEVRFWTAAALEEISSASAVGRMELHALSLSVFLETFQGDQKHLRLPALLRMANTVPESINCNVQLRLLPEIRKTFVEASFDDDPKVREVARKTLSSWRWQKVVQESHRMTQQYLAETHDLESLASETLVLGKSFAAEPPTIEKLRRLAPLHDAENGMISLTPGKETSPISSANSVEETASLVENDLQSLYRDHITAENPRWWSITSIEPDQDGLYFLVTLRWGNQAPGQKVLYVVPRPSMLSHANKLPSHWFETVYRTESDEWPAMLPAAIRPRDGVHIVLGEAARRDQSAFTATCDLFAHFITYYALVFIDREVKESPQAFTWSGRLASFRRYGPRFRLQGNNNWVEGGGGWDFHRLTFTCDRASGELTLSANLIEYPVTPMPETAAASALRTDELNLMGWKPLVWTDFYGSKLLPPEYNDAHEMFLAANENGAGDLLRKCYFVDKSLPHWSIAWGLLLEQTGRHDNAQAAMANAAADAKDPQTLTDVARWELGAGLDEQARKHVEAALRLHPENADAKSVLAGLSKREPPKTTD